MQIIHTSQAAPPAGHYAQAVVTGDLVFLSGILPIEADGSIDASEPFHVQAERVLHHAAAILKEAGTDLANVVKVAVYVTDIGDWTAFNEIYTAVFGTHTPARTVVPVPTLHHGFGVEIDLIASMRGS